MAEAAKNPSFDGYELVYDDIERGALMETEKFYGKKLMKRLMPPFGTKDKPGYSKTQNDMYGFLEKIMKRGKKIIYIPDSMDALKPDTVSKMGAQKAKRNAEGMRDVCDLVYDSGSILILISQAHMDLKSLWGGDSASGGRSLEFFATLDVWLRKVKAIKTPYNKFKYVTGSLYAAHITKNRLRGKDRTIYFPFDPDYGIDNIGSCIDFLTIHKHWPKSKGRINAKELGLRLKKKALIRTIETAGRERELEIITAKAWNEIEAALRTDRKPRYS
jgi:hypothetical protein